MLAVSADGRKKVCVRRDRGKCYARDLERGVSGTLAGPNYPPRPFSNRGMNSKWGVV
jgi:hypothetical protein